MVALSTMNPVFPIVLSTILISILSLSSVFLLFFKEHILKQISIFLVAFAAGALMGAAFLHLLPEAIKSSSFENPFIYILFGFLVFFSIEKILHWHHTHRETKEPAPLGILSLWGDMFHNFIDGFIIAGTFFADPELGFIATLAVALHEIPQEISEFGVLLYAGFSKLRAFFLNFLSATSVVIGGVVGYFLGDVLRPLIPLLLFFAVGTFLYLGASDFVPEIRKEEGGKRSVQLFLVFLGGVGLMWFFTVFE